MTYTHDDDYEYNDNETLKHLIKSDVAGRFNISDGEAARIADRAATADEFVAIWEDEDWWLDDPDAPRW